MKTLYQFNLTPLVIDYQQGKIDETAVLTQCSLFVFWKLQRDQRLDEDVRQDFYLDFVRFVKKSLLTFSYQGIPFERYLLSIMKKRIISFQHSSRRERLFWRITSDVSFAPSYQAENSRAWPILEQMASLLGLDPAAGRVKPRDRKWFLVWMLKHNRFLDADDVKRVARLSGRDERWLEETVALLRRGLASREARLGLLRRRRNRLFVLARVLELRVRDELDQQIKETYARQLRRKRSSLRNVMRAIAHIGLYPSHSRIAEVTGIPKGTVDSIAARLKKILEAEKARYPARIA